MKTVPVGELKMEPVVIMAILSHSVRKWSGRVGGYVLTCLFFDVCFSPNVIEVGFPRPSDTNVIQERALGVSSLIDSEVNSCLS